MEHHEHKHHHHGGRDDLAGSLERCSRLFSQSLGNRRGQGRILRILCEQDRMSQKELQEQLHIQPGSMSEIAAKLENKGLIVRVRNETDKRKILLSATDAGREWVARHDEAAVRQQRAELFSALTPEEQDALRVLLDKLSASWSRQGGKNK
ncbi:MarR family transcriptional regulator [Enterocloster clostridioformis]|uniref:MarR family winged helix-turn-helix transcriptional regulator n=1 Tax=Enterocloster clostridioformis TaxID=1531 RepID=UPI00080C3EDC|nr:MarR family transcriptional regulator [Enterocloster clostridioformis]ANU48021.1 MarR family transcriptional regulator [Lachnoclostridium sp. YL32]NDO32534.1 MarR family transcriptional regulator [Enterocloster clostridioformis]OXE69267.1 MarR family transcriptional regulator [Enterocloster clostridioformis]QQR03086.1 MarR family transcriptional regulator [Enterocloster clostridioformis]